MDPPVRSFPSGVGVRKVVCGFLGLFFCVIFVFLSKVLEGNEPTFYVVCFVVGPLIVRVIFLGMLC